MESLFCNNTIKITPQISLKVATLEEILFYGEKEYYNLLASLTATPYEIMAQLYLSGIDYENIDEYDLFIDNFRRAINNNIDMSILFGDLKTSEFNIAKNNKLNEMVLYNEKDNIVIDRLVYTLISTNIRKILFSSPPKQKAGNKEAKDYLIERAVKKYKRQINKEYTPFLENSIIALVNTEQFKYNYEESMKLNIYLFNASLRQILKKLNYDNVIRGIYSGTISSKEIDFKEIDWLSI